MLCILTPFLFSSCLVFHSGNVSSGPLLSANDTYKSMASGSSRLVFVFGLGSLKNRALVQKAKKNMYYKFPLQKNEYYSNMATDINKKIILGFIDVTNVTVSADILSRSDTSMYPFSIAFNKLITPFVPMVKDDIPTDTSKYNGSQLVNGDTLMYTYKDIPYQQYIASSLDKESVILKSLNEKYPSILVPLNQNTFYIQNRLISGLTHGDKVVIQVVDPYESRKTSLQAIVCGFCNNHVLVKTSLGYLVQKLSEIKK